MFISVMTNLLFIYFRMYYVHEPSMYSHYFYALWYVYNIARVNERTDMKVTWVIP